MELGPCGQTDGRTDRQAIFYLLGGPHNSNGTKNSEAVRVLEVSTLGDFTFAEPIRSAKVRSKYLLKPKSEVISLSESLTYKSMV